MGPDYVVESRKYPTWNHFSSMRPKSHIYRTPAAYQVKTTQTGHNRYRSYTIQRVVSMFLLRDAVYLIELGFYGPLVPAVVFILLIHGLKAPYTWRPIVLPLFLLVGLRIAGASLGLAAMTPGKSDLLTTATLLDTIGLAPVLCMLIGLLVRA